MISKFIAVIGILLHCIDPMLIVYDQACKDRITDIGFAVILLPVMF